MSMDGPIAAVMDELPEGWQIAVFFGRETSSVFLYDPNGDGVYF